MQLVQTSLIKILYIWRGILSSEKYFLKYKKDLLNIFIPKKASISKK